LKVNDLLLLLVDPTGKNHRRSCQGWRMKLMSHRC
jgi:hypothetical protein